MVDNDLNVTKEDVSISFSKLHLLSFPVVVIAVLCLSVPFIMIYGKDDFVAGFHSFIRLRSYFPVLIIGMVVHELIHGLSWSLLANKNMSAIRYGISKKTLTPYAHCKEPISARAYKIGALLPGIIMGVIPGIIAIIIGNSWLLMFGNLFTLLAAGDFVIVALLWKVKDNRQVEDHPSRAGCYIYN